MEIAVIVIAVVAVFLLSVLSSSVRVLREYERGVVFRLGRLIDLKNAGLVLLIPVVDRMVRVSLRVITLNVPPQDVITRDNVPVRVTAVAYFRIVDANKAIVEVEDYFTATSQIAQTSLRAVLGKAELDTLLAERERLNEDLQKVIDQQTEPWGVKVLIVEIKDVDVPDSMQRAIARQAEAERERRAKVINAEGEFQASARLADAADVMSRNPSTLQLRYLQTLTEISSGSSTTTLIPLPVNLLSPLLQPLLAQQGLSAEVGPQQPSRGPAMEGQLAEREGGGSVPQHDLAARSAALSMPGEHPAHGVDALDADGDTSYRHPTSDGEPEAI